MPSQSVFGVNSPSSASSVSPTSPRRQPTRRNSAISASSLSTSSTSTHGRRHRHSQKPRPSTYRPVAPTTATDPSVFDHLSVSPTASTSTHSLQEQVSPNFRPPTTCQYWTSIETRRAEYAAIDNANRGVRGWVMRKIVPEFLQPRDVKQHVAFDDDTGSVRRYRLDIDDENQDASPCKQRRKRMFSWASKH